LEQTRRGDYAKKERTVKLRTFFTTFVVSTILATSAFGAGPWKRASMRADDGSTIEINYEIQEVVRGNMVARIAAPLWINVLKRDSAQLHAVLLNFRGSPYKRDLAELVMSTQVELTSRGTGHDNTDHVCHPGEFGNYDGQAKQGLHISFCKGADCDQFFQEVAIVDEKGNWLVDPISRSHNFQFQLR